MAKIQRRQFTEAFKRKTVKRVHAGMTVQDAAEKYDLAETVVRTWARDPRFGGSPDWRRRGANGAVEAMGLPTVEKQTPARAKHAVAIAWRCPHCGGPITLGGDA